MSAFARVAAPEARGGKQCPHLERRLVGGGHEHDVAAHDVAEGPGQEWVMGAAEEERVDLAVAHRSQQPFGEHVHLLGSQLAPLDELHESRAGGTGEMDGTFGAPLGRHRPLVGA